MIAHTHGAQLIMFSFLNGSDWLDPSNFVPCLTYVIHTPTWLISFVPLVDHGLFPRMRILVGGHILEDIDMYHTVHEKVQSFYNGR